MTVPPVLARARQVLTVREFEAFELAVRGMSTRSIALALGVSRSAVRSRLENAHRKIHAATRKETAS